MTDLGALAWPVRRLHEGLPALARRAGLEPREAEPVEPAGAAVSGSDGDGALEAWIDAASERLGVEAELVRPALRELDEVVRGAAPALVALPADGEPRVLLVLSGGRRTLRVLTPELEVRRVAAADVGARLRAPLVGPSEAALGRLLDDVGLHGRARARAGAALTAEHLGGARVGRVWLLRVPAGRSPLLQARRSGLVGRAGVVVGAHLALYVLYLASWYTIGKGALEGGLELGWLLAWALLLLTLVPLRALEAWSEALFTAGVGALFKRRLLQGALRHHPDEIRHEGAGRLLARVLESEAVETLALSSAFHGVTAVIELALAAWVLSHGAGGGWHVGLLGAWVALAGVLALRHHRHVRASTDTRLEVSCDLVERMVGHRTRLAQQAPEHWHETEDALLERYLADARGLDRSSVLAGGFLPASWLAVALAALAPAFVAGSSVTALAVAVGGALVAQQALGRLSNGALQAVSLAVAWRKVAPMFRAAAREEPAGVPGVVRGASGARRAGGPAAARDARGGWRTGGPAAARDARGEWRAGGAVAEPTTLLELRDVVYRYPGREAAGLRGCSLRVRDGDRVLVTGPSGGGKSTLVAQMTGLRRPTSGLVTLGGLDRDTWGAETWRRRVTAAPQYHDNRVFTGTLAYNLLLGRGWPAEDEDLAEAETLCRELGLGDLLDRMPAGLHQTVGETGWQLSHGERSRVFLARALLQNADVVVFDESFAALDPATLRRSMDHARTRARALVAIAHP